MFLGLRTVIYPAPVLEESRAWFASMLGIEPYFDQPFYVGFNVGGYELGLDPQADPTRGAVTYWGVPNAEGALADLLNAGATPHGEVTDVGEGIRVATVIEPGGALLGVIENPHFTSSASAVDPDGPGR